MEKDTKERNDEMYVVNPDLLCVMEGERPAFPRARACLQWAVKCRSLSQILKLCLHSLLPGFLKVVMLLVVGISVLPVSIIAFCSPCHPPGFTRH